MCTLLPPKGVLGGQRWCVLQEAAAGSLAGLAEGNYPLGCGSCALVTLPSVSLSELTHSQVPPRPCLGSWVIKVRNRALGPCTKASNVQTPSRRWAPWTQPSMGPITPAGWSSQVTLLSWWSPAQVVVYYL